MVRLLVCCSVKCGVNILLLLLSGSFYSRVSVTITYESYRLICSQIIGIRWEYFIPCHCVHIILIENIQLKLLWFTKNHFHYLEIILRGIILLTKLFVCDKNYHHHHVMPLARISLTLPCHFSLSFIISGWSSGLHPVSSHRC